MKYITLFILFLSFSSCYKKECGSNMPLQVVFTGFDPQEKSKAILLKYTKGSNFATLNDSSILSDLSIGNLDFDYKIMINAQEIFISNLNIEQKSIKKFGLVKTKEFLICPLEDNFLVQGTNATQHGDTVFIAK